jgi:hypothetical protein
LLLAAGPVLNNGRSLASDVRFTQASKQNDVPKGRSKGHPISGTVVEEEIAYPLLVDDPKKILAS